ncbi:MAG: 16S rRNA (cytidine1402-2'-O)-methyltransferase, partial [Marinobacter sp. T13-3]
AQSVRESLEADPNGARGEFVVMVHGAPPAGPQEAGVLDADRLLSLLVAELPVKKAARIVADVSGLSKNELYQRALALKDQ